LACLQFVESTIGTRYPQFLTVGIREHFDASLVERMAAKMVNKYRVAFLKDSAALGYKSGLLRQNEFGRFSRYFSDSPIAVKLESGMFAKFDTLPPRMWPSTSAELEDSIVAQIARIAPDYLSKHEIKVLDSMFATFSGKPLDPRVHRDWFGQIESRNFAKFQQTYLNRWRRYEYATFRYPKTGQEIDFRGIKFKIILKGELLDTEELNSDYDGVDWLV
jgi:hypothetical protein